VFRGEVYGIIEVSVIDDMIAEPFTGETLSIQFTSSNRLTCKNLKYLTFLFVSLFSCDENIIFTFYEIQVCYNMRINQNMILFYVALQ